MQSNNSSLYQNRVVLLIIWLISFLVTGLTSYFLGRYSATVLKHQSTDSPIKSPQRVNKDNVFNSPNFPQQIKETDLAPGPTNYLAVTPPYYQVDNWQSYQNDQYGYRLEYPSNFKIDTSNIQKLTISFRDMDNWPAGIIFEVQQLQNPQQLSLKELGNQNFSFDSASIYDLGWQNSTLAGEEAIVADNESVGGTYIIYLTNHNNQPYAIYFQFAGDEYQDLGNQLISRFGWL